MYKSLPIVLPKEPGSILVSGADGSCDVLYSRFIQAIEAEKGWSVMRVSAPIPGYDYLYHVGDSPEFSYKWFKGVYLLSPGQAEGRTYHQGQLSNSDWQATRDIERQLLAMHEAGIWQMPDDVRQRMLDREQMRLAVDDEIAQPQKM